MHYGDMTDEDRAQSFADETKDAYKQLRWVEKENERLTARIVELEKAVEAEREAFCQIQCIWCRDIAAGVTDIEPAERAGSIWIHRYKLGNHWSTSECYATALRARAQMEKPE